jgi:hypothetical protein
LASFWDAPSYTVHTRVQFVAYQHVVKEEFNLVHTMEVGLLFAQQLRPT